MAAPEGVSTGEMGDALEILVGAEASGFSASTVSRLMQACAEEYKTWREALLDGDEWGGGVCSGLRGEDADL